MASAGYDPGTPQPPVYDPPTGTYLVRSWCDQKVAYQVNLAAGSCTCPDHENRGRECMHLRDVKARRKTERPDPAWVCGVCPECGEELVTDAYHVGGRGYVLFRECWASLDPEAERTCSQREEVIRCSGSVTRESGTGPTCGRSWQDAAATACITCRSRSGARRRFGASWG